MCVFIFLHNSAPIDWLTDITKPFGRETDLAECAPFINVNPSSALKLGKKSFIEWTIVLALKLASRESMDQGKSYPINLILSIDIAKLLKASDLI